VDHTVAGHSASAERTVVSHIEYIMANPGIDRRAQIAVWAIQQGLMEKMTILTIMTSTTDTSHDGSWGVAEAKARLSEVIDRALSDGPQVITRKGRRAVVVVSAEEWERKTQRRGTLVEFLAESPLRNSGLVLDRPGDAPRDVDL
jgi:prevent-host-death family protein